MMAPTPKTTRMGTNWWERVVVQRSACAVDAQVTTLTERSPLLVQQQQHGGSPHCSSSDSNIAMLYREELELGRLLGSGTYSNVYEVTGLELLDEQSPIREDGEPLLDSEARKSLKIAVAASSSSSSSNNTEGGGQGGGGGPKYAIKHLKPDLLKDTKTFEHAACDLIMEAKFLAQLSHPNILPIHGVAYGGAATFACTGLYDSFFIVVDKIQETLSDRLRRWRLESISNRLNHENSVLAKIEIALQVANALSYLHERRLVFRDLKPQNIGLTVDGIVQLFDFGFCRELPSDSSKNNGGGFQWAVGPVGIEATINGEVHEGHEHDDRLYGMSGKGTLMYMSPEVLGTRRYNRKADVYGWATIFYEMLTLQRPYTIESVEGHRQAIYKRGERPPLKNTGIAQPLQKLLVNCWDGNIVNRFSMKEAKAHLEFIHSDFIPGILTTESFHKCVSSTKKLLSPIHDAIFTFANDVQTGYENLIKDIAGLPRPATFNKDPGTMRTVMMRTSDDDCSSSLSSSVGGLSFAADDEREDKQTLLERINREQLIEELPPGVEAQEVVLADSVTSLEEISEEDISEETVQDDGPKLGNQRNPQDGCPSVPSEEKECSKLPHANSDKVKQQADEEEEARDPVATTSTEEEVEDLGEIRRRRRAPRSPTGTLVYHRYYGHMSLNVGKMDDDQEIYEVHKMRSLWSIHCVARAA